MDALAAELPLDASPLIGGTAGGRAAWERAAATAARRAGVLAPDTPDTDVLDALSRRTVDGIVIPALSTRQDAAGLDGAGLPGQSPFVRGARRGPTGGPQGSWDIRSSIQVADATTANQLILWELEHGASSIWLPTGTTGIATADLPQALSGVYLDFAPIVFQPDPGVEMTTLVAAYGELIADRDLQPASSSNLGADPLGQLARHGAGDQTGASAAPLAVAATAALMHGIRAAVIDATVINDAGGTDTQELGYSMSAGLAYLRGLEAAGIDPGTACGLIDFRYAATDEQFPTISKLRAARRLWDRLTQLCGVAAAHRGQTQHAVTSAAMLTRYDPWVNMIRGTVAAFAAGVGGAESLTVRSFDEALGSAETLGRRVSRNTSLLLLQEAHVGAVQDPAGGAYAIEVLTDRLAEAAWQEFQEIEAAGGLPAVLSSGWLAARLAVSTATRTQRIAHQRQVVTGITDFPLLGETPLVRMPLPAWPAGPGALPQIRYAADFESLRDSTGGAPVGLIAEPGAAVAAVSWAENVLTAGGIEFASGDVGGSARVICLVPAAAEVTSTAISELRGAGASRVIVVSPRQVSAPEADDRFSPGDDLLAFLHRTREYLGDNV